MSSLDRCPTCKRPYYSPVRFCFKCKKAIAKHDKWKIMGSSISHRDCTKPEEYPKGQHPLESKP